MKEVTATLLKPTGIWRIGVCRVELVDEKRPDLQYPQGRPIPLHIYFPTVQGTQCPYKKINEPYALKKFPPLEFLGFSKRSALSELAPGKHPLVFLNHGNYVAATYYALIAEELASHGFVVISPQHQLDTDEVPKVFHGRSFSKHARIVDNLLVIFEWIEENRSTLFEHKIDCTKVGLIGHSMSGNALLMLSQRISGIFRPETIPLLPHSSQTEVKECIIFIDGEFDYPAHGRFPLFLCLSEERAVAQKESLDLELMKSGYTFKVYPGSRHVSFMDHSWILRMTSDQYFKGTEKELEIFWQELRNDIHNFLKKSGVSTQY